MMGFGFLGGLVVLPIVYLVVLFTLVMRRNVAGVGESIAFFILAVGTATWAILQSRASTAGIGFIGLPFLGTLAGFLGLAFGRWRTSPQPVFRGASWVALGGMALVILVELREGAETRAKNSIRDVDAAAHAAEIARDRDSIAVALKANPGRERAYIDSAIRARMTDRAFLIAALEVDSVSPGILDTLATSPDLGITLQAVRNPNAQPATLARVYSTHTYPFYFYQALAQHPNTPPEILRELYTKPGPIGGLHTWLAGNPSTPHDILDELARTTREQHVVHMMLENPAVDCGLLGHLSNALASIKKDSAQFDSYNVVRLNELKPTVCAATAVPTQ